MSQIQAFLVSIAASWLVLPCVTAIAAIDGFFPPVPSETSVVAIASVYASQGLWSRAALLVVFAACGALIGDNIAYWIGRIFKPGQWRVFAEGKGRHAYDWAAKAFVQRGGPLILAARYIPVGRVAVNVIAGSLRFPYRRFLAFDLAAGLTWGLYSTGIGLVGGTVVEGNPLLAVGLGMVLALVIGWAMQKVFSRRLGFAEPPAGGAPPPPGPAAPEGD
jgi:membrane protein DedA with SNARE-associated domain